MLRIVFHMILWRYEIVVETCSDCDFQNQQFAP